MDYDVVCFSHLRWEFVFQRPQQLMTRCAQRHRVLFVERPVCDGADARLDVREMDGVRVVTPCLPGACDERDAGRRTRLLVERLLEDERPGAYVVWYYDVAAHEVARHLRPIAAVYDCMDQVGSFADARPGEEDLERRLLADVDVVFTGGRSLFEAKRMLHPDVHLFPSSVDRAHFERARAAVADPADQAPIPHPRLGWFGVIEERVDLELLAWIAAERPRYQVVMVGPVVRLDPAALPQRANIHYLGQKEYAELPSYLAGWDVAIMPFALNRATEFISPTKTLEYLAGAKPVVSTAVRDVVRPYGEAGLVRIARDPDSFVRHVDEALAGSPAVSVQAIDALLDATSWDETWASMERLVDHAVAGRG